MVLISILGDFHSSILPVFFQFKEQIKKHIIVYDDSTYDKKVLDNLLKGQEVFLKSQESIFFELETIKVDEDNYESILGAYKKIIQRSANPKDIFLNATDGLTSIALLLSTNLLQYGSNVLAYDRYANTYNLHTKSSMNKHKITEQTDIKTHLRLIGYDIKMFTNRFQLNNRKESVLELTKDLKIYKEFAKLYGEDKYQAIETYPRYATLLSRIDKENDLAFIQGTTFEEYIYHLINDNLQLDDIMTAVEIEFSDNFRNELDILIMKDNHLHTIECKFVNSLNGEHYVYKTDSIMDYLDNDGKAMILSVSASNETVTKNYRKKVQFSQGTRARAKNANIGIYQSELFDEEHFLNELQQCFNLEKIVN